MRLPKSERPNGVSRLLLPVEPAERLVGNWNFWPVIAIDPTGGRVAYVGSQDDGFGGQIYRGAKQVMAVDLSPGTTLQLSAPRAVLDDVYETKGLNHIGFDIAPDGRFIFVRDNQGTAIQKYISIVENFLLELKKQIK